MGYTRNDKAQAIALVATGVSSEKVAVELALHPRSVQRWVKRSREMSAKETLPDDIRAEDLALIRRSQELINDAYDDMEDTGVSLKHLISLNAIKGTAQDKEHARKDSGRQTIIMNFAERPTDMTITDVTELVGGDA